MCLNSFFYIIHKKLVSAVKFDSIKIQSVLSPQNVRNDWLTVTYYRYNETLLFQYFTKRKLENLHPLPIITCLHYLPTSFAPATEEWNQIKSCLGYRNARLKSLWSFHLVLLSFTNTKRKLAHCSRVPVTKCFWHRRGLRRCTYKGLSWSW